MNVQLVDNDRAPNVEVNIVGLLRDTRFLGAMESGFPLYVEYDIELRRSGGWFGGGTESELTWEFVVFFDPVRELYIVEARGVTEQFSSVSDLRIRIAQRYRIEDLHPEESGRYHYFATITARTLSDSDVDEVFAWLDGEHGDSTELRRPGFVTRVARRLLVQVAPLPRLTLEGRTRHFLVP